MTATTKQQLRAGRANFSKADARKHELHRMKDLAASLIGDRAKVHRNGESANLELWIDRKLIVSSKRERAIEDKIREAATLLIKQQRLANGV